MPLPTDAAQFTPWRLTSSYVELIRLDQPFIRFWFVCVDPQTRVGSNNINFKILLGPTFSQTIFQGQLQAPVIQSPNPIIQFADTPKLPWNASYSCMAAENYRSGSTNYNGANGTIGIINTGPASLAINGLMPDFQQFGRRLHGNRNRYGR